jgi:formamidopyrimidine-DNA glycosylase
VPELPDVTVYVEAIARRTIGQPLTGYAIRSVFALRSVDPPLDAVVGHAVRGADALAAFERGGLEPLDATRDAFAERLARENHTLKRSLTDPRLFSGIGNAYSDEILHRARLSPLKLTSRLSADEATRLYDATRATLTEWTDRLRAETGDGFPEKVTAFREGMAVHGRYREPCPVCGTAVQRIRYRDNETNYCPRCQTEGRLLADRALSRLLHEDWPRTVEELEG